MAGYLSDLMGNAQQFNAINEQKQDIMDRGIKDYDIEHEIWSGAHNALRQGQQQMLDQLGLTRIIEAHAAAPMTRPLIKYAMDKTGATAYLKGKLGEARDYIRGGGNATESADTAPITRYSPEEALARAQSINDAQRAAQTTPSTRRAAVARRETPTAGQEEAGPAPAATGTRMGDRPVISDADWAAKSEAQQAKSPGNAVNEYGLPHDVSTATGAEIERGITSGKYRDAAGPTTVEGRVEKLPGGAKSWKIDPTTGTGTLVDTDRPGLTGAATLRGAAQEYRPATGYQRLLSQEPTAGRLNPATEAAFARDRAPVRGSPFTTGTDYGRIPEPRQLGAEVPSLREMDASPRIPDPIYGPKGVEAPRVAAPITEGAPIQERLAQTLAAAPQQQQVREITGGGRTTSIEAGVRERADIGAPYGATTGETPRYGAGFGRPDPITGRSYPLPPERKLGPEPGEEREPAGEEREPAVEEPTPVVEGKGAGLGDIEGVGLGDIVGGGQAIEDLALGGKGMVGRAAEALAPSIGTRAISAIGRTELGQGVRQAATQAGERIVGEQGVSMLKGIGLAEVGAVGGSVYALAKRGLTTTQRVEDVGMSVAPMVAQRGYAAIKAARAGIGKIAAKGGEEVAEKGVEEEAGAMAGESALPGIGEILMGATAIGGLIKGAIEGHKIHQEEKQEQQQTGPAPAAPQQGTGIAFDSAPVIDSSDYHHQ